MAAFPSPPRNPKAQAWFDYGIKMFHAFYHDDARRAFDNAVAADPDCAMCLWGQALSRGAVLNFDAEEADFKAALEIGKARAGQARARGTGCSPPPWCADIPDPGCRRRT